MSKKEKFGNFVQKLEQQNLFQDPQQFWNFRFFHLYTTDKSHKNCTALHQTNIPEWFAFYDAFQEYF